MAKYFAANRELGLHFNALVFAASRVKRQLKDSSALDNPLRNSKNWGRVEAFAMLGYQKSLGRDASLIRRKATRDGVADDLRDALQDVYQLMLVKVASLFETFTQCWALNYLLTRLERNETWLPREQKLADQLCPVLSERLPNWSQIVSGIPMIATELRALPHIFYRKNTTEEITVPVSPTLNALSAIAFWRNYRNLVIHRSGIVSSAFYQTYSPLFEELRRPFGSDIPPLAPGQPMRLTDAVPRAMATTHYRAAARLGRRLAEFSGSLRGHIAAPGPEVDVAEKHGMVPKPLLIPGDHELSYRWVFDPRFRTTIAERLQSEGRQRGAKPPKLPLSLLGPTR